MDEFEKECSNCEFWNGSDNDEFGVCEGMLQNTDMIQIELDTGNGGGWVNTIKTSRDFYCKLYE